MYMKKVGRVGPYGLRLLPIGSSVPCFRASSVCLGCSERSWVLGLQAVSVVSLSSEKKNSPFFNAVPVPLFQNPHFSETCQTYGRRWSWSRSSPGKFFFSKSKVVKTTSYSLTTLPSSFLFNTQYTGIEASVRAYFPEGYHLAYMVLGGYATIIALSQIRGSFASAAKIAAIPAPEAPDYHTREYSIFFMLLVMGGSTHRSLPPLTLSLPFFSNQTNSHRCLQ